VNQRTQKNRDDQKLNPELPQLQTPSAGQPLEAETRAFMEPRFAHSFANVRVHADSAADQLARGYEAQAFAFGDDLYFRDGAYDPSSAQGLHTLAHELTHVVQQSGHGKDGFSEKVASSHSRSETEAHAAARAVTMGGHANVSTGSAGAVQVAKMDENEAMAAVPQILPPPLPDAPMPQIPGPAPVPTNIPGLPEGTPGPGRIPPVGVGLGAGIAGALAGIAAFLWPKKTAPRWMDEMNPLTGQPYTSEQEFQQVQQEMQRRALEQQAAGTPSAP
jgi:Domain of unknown function (DUF4157)